MPEQRGELYRVSPSVHASTFHIIWRTGIRPGARIHGAPQRGPSFRRIGRPYVKGGIALGRRISESAGNARQRRTTKSELVPGYTSAARYRAVPCPWLRPCACSRQRRPVPPIHDDVHFTQLQAERGGSTPTGANVAVSQAEAAVVVNGQYVWMVDPGVAEFAGKTLTDASNGPPGLFSGHATAVGQQFYGTLSSIAPGITNVSVYWADAWIGNDFLNTGVAGASALPLASTSRIANHSWAGAWHNRSMPRSCAASIGTSRPMISSMSSPRAARTRCSPAPSTSSPPAAATAVTPRVPSPWTPSTSPGARARTS